MIRKPSASLIYKLFWVHYLIFHTFFSSSNVVSEPVRYIVLISGVVALIGHSRDKKNYLFIFHKALFVFLNIFPFAIDNRVMVAMFESVAYIVLMLKFNDVSCLVQTHRWILALTFFFAGFHKLNSSHLLSKGSCSNFVIENIISLPASIQALIPFLAVALEFAIAAVILIRWQYFWVLLLVFTIPLSISGFHQFMAILWVLAVPLIFTRGEPEKSKLALALGIVFSINALMPYLEIKNAASMNMYSNLIIKDGKTNHYLISSTLHLTDNLRDTVKIIKSDYPFHQEGIIIPRKILQKQLKLAWGRHQFPTIIFEENGRIYETGKDMNKDFDLIKDLSFFDYYFLSLGYMNYDENACIW